MKLSPQQKAAYEALKKYGPMEVSTQINKRTADSLVRMGLAESVYKTGWGDTPGRPTVSASQCCLCDEYKQISDETNKLCKECEGKWAITRQRR